jgi:hypothetical protein
MKWILNAEPLLNRPRSEVAFVSGQLQAGHCDDEPSCGGNGLK